MGEYDSGPRSLPWPLLHPLVGTRTVEDDGDFPPSSFVWPDDPNERTTVLFWLSLNEYNVLGSTIDVGSDIAFGEDALRVMWLWMRNFRIEVPMPCCDEILAAIAALQTGITNQEALQLTQQVTQRALSSKALRDALEDAYDGNPTSINPDAPTTDFGSSGARFDALCAGLMAFVYQFARAQADSVRAGQVGGLAAIALIAALLIPGLNIFFLVGASIAVLGGLGVVGVTTEAAIQALTDTEALDSVVCCMTERLDTLPVSEANWLTALSGCAFSPGSNEQIISDFLTATLADNYLTILNILGQAYTGVIDGETLPECPTCVNPPDPGCVDLTVTMDRWQDTGQTKWYSGSGFGPTHAGGVEQWILNRQQDIVGRTIVEVRFYFNMPFNNVKVTMGIVGNAVVSTGAGDAIIMNEASHPSLFPYFSGGSGMIQIASNAPSFIVPSGALRMIEACLVS